MEPAALTATAENVRPWGRYDVLDRGPGWQVKRITVSPGQRLSYQRHARRAERWVIVAGAGVVTLDGVDTAVAAGDMVQVAVGVKHRIACAGAEPLVFIETQVGDYLGEDDIERLSDDYGRAAA